MFRLVCGVLALFGGCSLRHAGFREAVADRPEVPATVRRLTGTCSHTESLRCSSSAWLGSAHDYVKNQPFQLSSVVEPYERDRSEVSLQGFKGTGAPPPDHKEQDSSLGGRCDVACLQITLLLAVVIITHLTGGTLAHTVSVYRVRAFVPSMSSTVE